MNVDTVFTYAGNFLQSLVGLLQSWAGVVVLGVGITLFVVYLFNDLRR